MNKSEIYRKLKRAGIKVKWIGTTKKQLQDLLNTNTELSNIIDEPIEIPRPPRPSRAFKRQLKKEAKKEKRRPIMAFVEFEVLTKDGNTFTYSKQFRATRSTIDKVIQDFITNSELEYDNVKVTELSRTIQELSTTNTENSILNRPLRQYGAPNITKYVENNTWNFTVDECVIDYILNRLYPNKPISRDIIRKALNSSIYDPDKKHIITPNNIIELAKHFNVNIYITHFNKLAYKAINNDGHKHKKCLVFEARNNHVYPINDKSTISKIMKTGNPNYKKDNYTNNFGNIVFHPSNKEDGVKFLLQKINETNMHPFGKINMKNGKIMSFILDDTLYVCHPDDNKIREYCQNKNIEYYGQSIQTFIKPYVDKVPYSFMNVQVLDALSVCQVKNRTHIGNLYNRQSREDDVNLDLTRCYSGCIKYPYDKFMTTGFNTTIVTTNKLHGLGLYYVKTDDMTLLHGSNWYSNKIIEIAMQEQIPLTIEAYIRGDNADFTFDAIIDELIHEFNDNNKIAINSLIGYFAKTSEEVANVYVTTDFEDVVPCLKKKNPILIEEGGHYLFGNETKYKLHKNHLPIWIQILDWSNIRLHNLIKEHGGYDNLVYRKTDMAIMRNTTVHPSTEWGGYKIETKQVIQQQMSTLKRVAPLYIMPIKQKWIKPEDIMSHLNKGKSLFIQGRAGTGKSYIIKEFSKNNNTIRLAFTNKAANNIDGQTLHTFFKIDSSDGINIQKSIKGIKAIFIDEISMIPSYIWSHIIELKNKSNVPIILVGDYRQLPPVEEDDHFHNPTLKWLTDFYVTELTEMQRYDQELWDYLENPYQLHESLFDSTAMHICHTNKCVDRINNLMNNIHVKNPTIEIDGMRLKNGVPLISLHTSKCNGIIKNEMYEICNITKDDIYINNIEKGMLYNSIPKPVKIVNFAKLFTLGYAMTTHKMQGSTVQGNLQIHEIGIHSDRRLFYTAYSRATKLSNISFCYHT